MTCSTVAGGTSGGLLPEETQTTPVGTREVREFQVSDLLETAKRDAGWADLNEWSVDVVTRALRLRLIRVVSDERPGYNLQLTRRGWKS